MDTRNDSLKFRQALMGLLDELNAAIVKGPDAIDEAIARLTQYNNRLQMLLANSFVSMAPARDVQVAKKIAESLSKSLDEISEINNQLKKGPKSALNQLEADITDAKTELGLRPGSGS